MMLNQSMMKTNINKLLFLLLVPAIFMACGNNKNEQEPQKTPTTKAGWVEQASFVTLKGDTIHVSDFKGKVVMIDFWETWCKPCIASFPTVDSLQQAFPNKFVALAVTPGFTDTLKDAQAFAKEHDYHFIYAMDTNKLHEKLEVRGIPFKVFIDANGKFIKTSVGSHGPEQDYIMIKAIIEKHSGQPAKTE